MLDRLADVTYQLFMRNRVAPYIIVLAGVELVIAAYYGTFEPERLAFELITSAFVVAIIGFPTIWYFKRQHDRLVRMSSELEILSTTDQMTGLLNRQTFLRRLSAILADTAWGDSAGAFAYIDADQFKTINDRYGHQVGDRVIQMIADSMKAAIRKNDLMARLGGDEFAMFLLGATVPQAAGAAERLREELRRRSADLPIPALHVTVSIGIASHNPGSDASDIMSEADKSLYAAKHGGRDAVVIDLKRFRAA